MSLDVSLMKRAFEVSRDAIVFLNREGFVDCNPAALSFFGYEHDERAEFLRKHPAELAPPLQPDGRWTFEVTEEQMRKASLYGFLAFPFQHRRRDGTTFPTEVMLASVEVEGVEALVAVLREVSEVQAAAAELHQVGRVAQELDQTLASTLPELSTLPPATGDAIKRCISLVKSLLPVGR